MITEAARAGDQFAIERLAELGDWIGQGVATLTAVLDPNVVVIGGGVSEAGDAAPRPDPEQLREPRDGPQPPADARAAPGPARQRGRHDRRRRPRTDAGEPSSIGVDIGGTKVLAAVVDEGGRVLDTETTPTPGSPGSGLEQASVSEVEDALVEVVVAADRAARPVPGGRRGRRLRRPAGRAGALRPAPALARRAARRASSASGSAAASSATCWWTTTPTPPCGQRRASGRPGTRATR